MRERTLDIIDTHTGGEPTRVVVGGAPDLGDGSMAEQLARLRREHDWVRRSIVNEPRGSEVMVGALVCRPADRRCAAGVIFFNNVGYLGMCGHGTIGLAAALVHRGALGPGVHGIETPVGVIQVEIHDAHTASIENVASHRLRADVAVDVPGAGIVRGDVAWGGNWFFLVREHGFELSPRNIPQLTDFAARVRGALARQGVTGTDGAEIDHVELFGPPASPENHSRNFVLCPGGAYDRSPCGTGTSAKLACLVADGKLKPGEVWRQESVIGSVFEGSVRIDDGWIIPRIRGRAYVNGEVRAIFDPADPFAEGIGG